MANGGGGADRADAAHTELINTIIGQRTCFGAECPKFLHMRMETTFEML